ncbi:hypothetical protein HRI_000044900 [Hibiscus trionum]|uniref:Uncharacterized protein n=1 Tax=Hibiscus trionum TaxID=183268 RepID=A0A9W7LGZ3_HIBTR|nr:hypothetical protein HRI_000044900 [Hibiscus trionum]
MAKAFSHINGNPMFYFPSTPNPNPPFPLLLPFNKPSKVTMSCNRSYWASISEDIEAHLKQAIPVREPLTVFEPMHRLTLAAPRNTAPALCVAACELVGGHRDQALPAASAIHLVYAASFLHEHIPLTESSRPKSNVEHAYGPSIELQIGDAMIPFGLELLAESDDPTQNNSDRILRVMVEITRTIGSQGMIHGQYYKVEPHESDDNESSVVEEIERVSKKYEGTLYGCAAACGAIIGGGNEEEIERMRNYGLYTGKIHGIMNRIGSMDKDWMKSTVEELRNLAGNELRGFDEAKVKAILNSQFSLIDSLY